MDRKAQGSYWESSVQTQLQWACFGHKIQYACWAQAGFGQHILGLRSGVDRNMQCDPYIACSDKPQMSLSSFF